MALLFGMPDLAAGLTVAVQVQMPSAAAVGAGVAAGLILEKVVMVRV